MIRVEKIDKYFNRFKKNQIHVINNTTLSFEDKGLVALLGPSGSGKTTLLNVIGGLDKVRRGKIFVNGKKITRCSQGRIDKIRNLNIGYIFQDYKLIENQSVYDNVALSLKLIGIKDKKEIDKRVCYILDRVGMLRFKKRPCSMLSGGERQRVGIARAIVKNPNIIIADEPTGNLDSKNTIEIMNIIKSISKDKLVILVTHEKDLAKFYATRIIELEDGKIISDTSNEIQDELNYGVGNNIYLKDFQYQQIMNNINIYTHDKEKIQLDIAVVNNNIYIKTNSDKKIEVINDDSTIEMINDHYSNISKNDIDKYSFDFKNIINESKKLRYSSIFNPITFITNGFKKVLDYSVLKKLLLLGFFASGMFIMFATSTINAALIVKDEKFVTMNKNYLIVNTKKINVDDYLKLEKEEDINYLLPTDSTTTIKIKLDKYYQLTNVSSSITGSLSDINIISKKDIIKGRLPENPNEIVVDKMVLDKELKKETTKMYGIINIDDYLDREILIDRMDNKKIVGITDLKSPSIYFDKNQFIWIIHHTKDNEADQGIYYNGDDSYDNLQYDDYGFYLKNIELKEGRWPTNLYETILPIDQKEVVKLNTEINSKVNGHKLKVVGYYYSKKRFDVYFVSTETLKYHVISTSKNITIYPKNKENVLDKVQNEYKMVIKDSYKSSRERYVEENKDYVRSIIITSAIILGISLIEILLMIRSSFLSRVKEVGIYRAIGVKKKDIYIMFSGEIIAITTLASIPGLVLSAYVLNILSKVDFLEDYLVVNPIVVLYTILLLYLFNLVVGLIPVFNTMRKRPAEILARTDI